MADIPAPIKNAIKPSTIIAGIVGFAVIAALFDVAGVTNWLLYPVSNIKNKFFKKAS